MSIVFPPFLEGFPFYLVIVQACQSYSQFHNCNYLSQIWQRAFARFLILPGELHLGVPNRTAIIQDWAHQSFISCLFYLLGGGGQEYKFLLRNPRVLLALVQTLFVCVFHLKSFVIVTPRYLMLSTFSRSIPSKVYEAWIFLIFFFLSAASYCI